jgi:hypothetical protein
LKGVLKVAIEIKLPTEISLKLSRLESKVDSIIENMLKDGAKVTEPKVKSNLNAVIGKGIKVKPSRSTGELVSSLGVTPVDIDRKGVYNVKIGFNEPRKHQYTAKGKRSYYKITNAMIANTIEYGRRGIQDAKPFFRPAKRATRAASIKIMQKRFDKEVKSL